MADITLSKPTTRIKYIDLIETLAMFFVVFYHTTYYEYSFLEGNGVLPYFYYYLRGFLSNGVTLFFLVNGYLLFSKPFYWKKHLMKVCRLILVTLCWSIITMVLLCLNYGAKISVRDLLKAVYEWKQGWISHYWYMAALIGCYAFFPLMKSAYDHCKPAFYFFVVFCLVCTFGADFCRQIITVGKRVILNMESGVSAYILFGRMNPFQGTYDYSFAYFCLGGVLCDVLPKIEKARRIKVNLIAVTCLLVSSIALFLWGIYQSRIYGKTWDIVFNGYSVVYTLINTLCIFVLCTNYVGKSVKLYSFFQMISKNTLGIYFTHLTIQAVIVEFSIEYPAIISWVDTGYMANLIYSFLLMTVSALLCAVCKKIPIVKELFV